MSGFKTEYPCVILNLEDNFTTSVELNYISENLHGPFYTKEEEVAFVEKHPKKRLRYFPLKKDIK